MYAKYFRIMGRRIVARFLDVAHNLEHMPMNAEESLAKRLEVANQFADDTYDLLMLYYTTSNVCEDETEVDAITELYDDYMARIDDADQLVNNILDELDALYAN